MLRAVTVASLLALLATLPLSAQEAVSAGPETPETQDGPGCPAPESMPAPPAQAATGEPDVPAAAPAWQTAWGYGGLRGIPAGPRTAPNGLEYHPNFSLDLGINFWVWRNQGLYLFGDLRLWGEKGEFGVTNARDGALGTSKREFDIDGGLAWNYAGPLELRAFGYTQNNLTRGDDRQTPAGFTDGFGLENRYYLSSEYDRLGQAGFDVTKATFLSIGYRPSKVMVGNDGHWFRPGMTLGAYLTQDLWSWPCYLFGDAKYIAQQSFRPRLFLFDVGAAARPLRSWQQWELRAGAENTGDFQTHTVQNLWYVALRFVF
jgi:hypothetical protein